MMNRVVVFIDGHDFYEGLIRNNMDTNINFYRFAKNLCLTRQLIRIYYYNTTTPRRTMKKIVEQIAYDKDYKKFISALQNYNLTIFLDGYEENINSQLIVNMLNYAVKNDYFKEEQSNNVRKVAERAYKKFIKALEEKTSYLTPKLEKNKDKVNSRLMVDMLNFGIRDMYDTAIIVSSNHVFIPTVEAVKDLGKNVELACFEVGSDDLKKTCDSKTIINSEILTKCLFKKEIDLAANY